MTDRLISADVLKSRVLQGQFKIGQDGAWYVLGLIDSTPTVEAEPIKHGRWINVNEGKWNTIYVLQCSACGEIDSRMYLNDSYCPHCGARMDEVEE